MCERLLYRQDRAPAVVLAVLQARGWEEYLAERDSMDMWSLLWTTGRPKPSDYATGRDYQRISHFPKTSLLCTKDNLARGLKRMKGIYGKVYNFSPQTFILPNEYAKFLQMYLQQPGAPWICKPADLSRGRKIFLFKDIKALQYDTPVIVQRYLPNPMLIGERKWDLRIYVLVTSYRPLTIYLYREGLARFSTEKFDMTDLSNKYSHLTNTSINKLNPGLGPSKEAATGYKWPLAQLRAYLTASGTDTDKLWREIKRIVVLTLLVIAQEVPQ